MDSDADQELARLRIEVDAVNQRLSELLHERARLVRAIAHQKREQGLPIVDRAREEEELARIAENTNDGFDAAAIRRIFTQIVSESRRLQEE